MNDRIAQGKEKGGEEEGEELWLARGGLVKSKLQEIGERRRIGER